MTSATVAKDYLQMSDEDFLNATPPAAVAVVEKPADEVEAVVSSDEEAKTDEVKKPEEAIDEEVEAEAAAVAKTEEGADADPDPDDTDGDPDLAAKPGDEKDPEAAKSKDAKEPESKKDGADKAADPADKDKDETVEPKPIDHEAFFKQVMAPFKANGRTITLRSPEEVIRLMQMGAGYGRKIQDLQPHLKVLRMLEKNDLLDESKISLLIDVNQKNPDAIKKIIKDSGIDPLDLNIEDNVSYTPKNHSVSDQEMAFQTALTDIQSLEGGSDTIREINQNWDQESKSLLWEQPKILGVIQSQRENGIYDQITAEIDRQKLLGEIPASTPFLQAYKLAGDSLTAKNGFKTSDSPAPQIQNQSGDTQQPQVIATKTAAPKAQVKNGDKAAAAAATKSATTRKAPGVNPLEMADDAFLKQFEGRF